MAALAIAAILGVYPALDLRMPSLLEPAVADVAPTPRWTPPPPPLRYGLALGGDELGGSVIQAAAEYEAGPASIAASMDYRVSTVPHWPNSATLAVSVGRRFGSGDRLDVHFARGLNRAGGGGSLGFTFSRQFR